MIKKKKERKEKKNEKKKKKKPTQRCVGNDIIRIFVNLSKRQQK